MALFGPIGAFRAKPPFAKAPFKFSARLIFIHLQCWEVLPFLTIQRQRCIKFWVLRAQDVYTQLALICQKGALEVYKNQSPIFPQVLSQVTSDSGKEPESLEFPIRANHPIRANCANRFARKVPKGIVLPTTRIRKSTLPVLGSAALFDYIKFGVLKAQDFSTPLSLNCQLGEHFPALEVYKNLPLPFFLTFSKFFSNTQVREGGGRLGQAQVDAALLSEGSD